MVVKSKLTQRTYKNCFLTIGITCLLIFSGVLLTTQLVSATEYKDQFLATDQYKQHMLILMGKDDELTVNFSINEGGPGDVYVLDGDQLSNYQSNIDFLPALAKENINNIAFKWTQPDDASYYLLIDNFDNRRDNDAYSGNNMTYDLTYDYTAADIEGFFAMLAGMFLICLAVSLVLAIIICVWIYKDATQRGKSGIVWVILLIISGIILPIIGPIGVIIIWLLVRPPLVGAPGIYPSGQPSHPQQPYPQQPPQYPPQQPPQGGYPPQQPPQGGYPPQQPPQY